MNCPPVRLGLIGAGNWGRNYIKTINVLQGVELTSLVSQNPESTSLVSPHCQIYTDWRELLREDSVDGVIVATPATLHVQITLAALFAGLPVMVEKPLALNVEDAMRVRQASVETGVLIMVDHTYLFHPAYQTLKQKLKKWEITYIRSQGWNWGPFRKEIDPLWDWAPHDLAMCLDLLGEVPKAIDATQLDTLDTPEGKGRIIKISLKFPCGTFADIIVGNIRTPKKRSFTVEFNEKTIIFDDCIDKKLGIRTQNNIEFLEISDELPLTRAIKVFVAGIRGKEDPRFGVTLGVQIVQILTKIDHFL